MIKLNRLGMNLYRGTSKYLNIEQSFGVISEYNDRLNKKMQNTHQVMDKP